MALSYQECLRLVKEAHPDLYPIWWIEKDGQYLFNMLKRGVSQEDATSNFYAVDSKNGGISPSLPVMEIYDNDDLSEKLDHPNEIDPEDRKPLEHQITLSGGLGWNIQTGNEPSLMHHGIKGQKWGVRRFQNEDGTLTQAGKERYGVPLDRVKKRADQIQKSKAEGGSVPVSGSPANKRYNYSVARGIDQAIKKDADEIYKRRVGDREVGFFEKMSLKDAARSEAILNNMEKPTPKELINREISKKGDTSKNVVKDIAWTVIDPVNVVFLTKDAIGSAVAVAKEKKYLDKRKMNSEFDEKTGFYKKTPGEYTEKQDLAAVNPRIHDINSNSKNNCMLCTTTYDLRQRGYDVTAQKDSYGYTFGDLKRWYPKAKLERISKFDENNRAVNRKDYLQNTMNALKKQGNGARGNLMVFFLGGGGHSVFYEVKDGNLIIKDGQVNKVYKNPEKFLKKTTICSYARLDNVQPDLKMIKAECCM